MTDIAANLENIKQRIMVAGFTAKRDANTVKLIAVSKGKSEEDIKAALDAGQRTFGENRVQEAQQKFSALRGAYPDLELHLIGPLQTNKVEAAVKLFDVIQTLDRTELADALVKAIQRTGRAPKIYLQVNIGREPQKSGIAPEMLDEFITRCRERFQLNITGLMCIPPLGEDPRPYFLQMRKLSMQYNLPHISMGMSSDFEEAIDCGATEIRVGTAIFGKR